MAIKQLLLLKDYYERLTIHNPQRLHWPQHFSTGK